MNHLDSRSLHFLVGKPCWGIVAGDGTGSTVELFLGNKLPRKRVSANKTLDQEIRENDPEFNIFIQCSWRLVSESGIICSSSWSSQVNGLALEVGLAQLKSLKVVSVDLNSKTLDLSITFENQITMSIFNDYVGEGDEDDSYWINSPEACFSVNGTNVSITNRGTDDRDRINQTGQA